MRAGKEKPGHKATDIPAQGHENANPLLPAFHAPRKGQLQNCGLLPSPDNPKGRRGQSGKGAGPASFTLPFRKPSLRLWLPDSPPCESISDLTEETPTKSQLSPSPFERACQDGHMRPFSTTRKVTLPKQWENLTATGREHRDCPQERDGCPSRCTRLTPRPRFLRSLSSQLVQWQCEGWPGQQGAGFRQVTLTGGPFIGLDEHSLKCTAGWDSSYTILLSSLAFHGSASPAPAPSESPAHLSHPRPWRLHEQRS